MQAGLSSFAFGWAVAEATPPMDELALTDVAARHRLGVLQLADNLAADRLGPDRLARCAARAGEQRVRLELGARGLTEAHLVRYLALCGQVGARLLRFVIDAPGYAPPVVEIRALLRNAVAVLAPAGVTLAIENHDRFPARVLRTLVDELGSRHVGICLDTANSLGAGEGLEFVVDLLAPVTVNLHVKDVAISRLPHQQGFTIEGRALGEGILPIQKAIDRVAIRGHCESVVLEGWTSPAGSLAETLAIEARRAEQDIHTLKRWLSGLVSAAAPKAPDRS